MNNELSQALPSSGSDDLVIIETNDHETENPCSTITPSPRPFVRRRLDMKANESDGFMDILKAQLVHDWIRRREEMNQI